VRRRNGCARAASRARARGVARARTPCVGRRAVSARVWNDFLRREAARAPGQRMLHHARQKLLPRLPAAPPLRERRGVRLPRALGSADAGGTWRRAPAGGMACRRARRARAVAGRARRAVERDEGRRDVHLAGGRCRPHTPRGRDGRNRRHVVYRAPPPLGLRPRRCGPVLPRNRRPGRRRLREAGQPVVRLPARQKYLLPWEEDRCCGTMATPPHR